MPKPLLIVIAGNTVPNVKERRGDFDAHFRASIGDAWDGPWWGVDARTEDARLPSPEACAGIIVTGSSSSVTERAPWMLRLEGYLREVVAAEVPLLGVCFGHQILASALGGEVRKNPRGRRIGSATVRRIDQEEGAADPLLEGVPVSFAVNLSHQDYVAVTPPEVRPLVTADHDSLHAFGVGRRARAVQFHPEFDADIIHGYLDARREILVGEGLDPDALHAAVTETPHARRVLRNFVRSFLPT